MSPMRLSLLLLVAFVLGCDLVRGPVAPDRDARPPSLLFATPEGESRTITIYLPRRFMDDSLGLQGVSREVPASQPPTLAALTALVAGPDGDEHADDFQYPLDRRTRIHGVQVENQVAILDLGAEIDRVRGRPYSELVFWSLVYTLTEIPDVERIALRRDGLALPELGDPAFTLPATAGRSDAPAWARPRSEPRTSFPPL
jgi:hypothetical protein